MKNTQSGAVNAAHRCLCAGTLHPHDAVDEVRRRVRPLQALLHIAETARREYLALPEAEREVDPDCHRWWDRSVPGEVYVGGEPVDLLLGVLGEYKEIMEGLIRCVERHAED